MYHGLYWCLLCLVNFDNFYFPRKKSPCFFKIEKFISMDVCFMALKKLLFIWYILFGRERIWGCFDWSGKNNKKEIKYLPWDAKPHIHPQADLIPEFVLPVYSKNVVKVVMGSIAPRTSSRNENKSPKEYFKLRSQRFVSDKIPRNFRLTIGRKKKSQNTRKHTIMSNSHSKQQKAESNSERLQILEQLNIQYDISNMFKEKKESSDSITKEKLIMQI